MTLLKTLVPSTLIVALACSALHAADISAGIEKIRQAGPKNAGQQQAVAGWKEVSQADVEQLPQILAGMDGANRLATNWLRAAADTVASRAMQQGKPLPVKALQEFLKEDGHAPHARSTAYELIARADADAASTLAPTFLNDTSLELRRIAVDLQMKAAAKAEDEKAAAQLYRTALTAARDVDQIQEIDEKLTKLGVNVDLPVHFGFITRWNLIAPFENADKSGWDVAYAPEKEIDLSETYAGKNGEVKWITHETEDDYGVVDLNKVIGKVKGAIAYAHCEFVAAKAMPCELRLGCINANKVWLNGKLLTANNVYHANTTIDQYTGQGNLKPGKNTILIKVCQNEQEENWAQRWQFQLRVCDKYGSAILSQDRKLKQTASLR